MSITINNGKGRLGYGSDIWFKCGLGELKYLHTYVPTCKNFNCERSAKRVYGRAYKGNNLTRIRHLRTALDQARLI